MSEELSYGCVKPGVMKMNQGGYPSFDLLFVKVLKGGCVQLKHPNRKDCVSMAIRFIKWYIPGRTVEINSEDCKSRIKVEAREHALRSNLCIAPGDALPPLP